MTGPYGITIVGDVAVITLSVPALWLLVTLALSGVFMAWTTVREWVEWVVGKLWKVATDTGTLPLSVTKGMKIWE